MTKMMHKGIRTTRVNTNLKNHPQLGSSGNLEGEQSVCSLPEGDWEMELGSGAHGWWGRKQPPKNLDGEGIVIGNRRSQGKSPNACNRI